MKAFFFGLIFFVSAFIFTHSETASAADGDSLFAGVQVHTVNIIFSQPNYWDSLVFYYNQGLEHFMPATVIANGITLNNTGVRLKGNSSYTHPNNKKSFRLSFNEFVSGQRWNGLRSVHLNNCWNDPTFIREKLHLDYCQNAGIVAPRCNYVRLSINDTLFAFYSMVEHINNSFYTSRFGTSEGEQFKAVDAVGTTNDIFSDFKWLGNDSTLYFNHYELKSDLTETTWRRLISFIDTLNHTNNVAASLPEKLSLNPFYKAMAADILLGNMDSYVYTGRNFYIFFPPPSNKLEWVVWDAGLSFGALPGGPSNIETLPVTYVSSDTGKPLFSKIINTPSLKNEYLLAFCNIFNTNFTTSLFYPKIDSIANIIRPFVYEDPRKMFTNAQFETNIISDIVVSGSRKPGLKSFIQLRRSSVQSQLNSLGVNCDVSVSNENIYLKTFELLQNFPNPFNPNTIISYQLKFSNYTVLKIYDVLGNLVQTLVNEKEAAGNYEIEFNGSNFSSGIYYYELSSGDFSQTKKMILVK